MIDSSATYPLTSNQLDVWSDQILHRHLPLYNIGGHLRLSGNIDQRLFDLSLKQLIRETDALRLVLLQSHDGPRQYFVDYGEFESDYMKITHHDFSSMQESDIQSWMQGKFSEPFSLFGSALCRFSLIKASSKQWYFLAMYHHIMIDGLSTALFTQRLSEIYSAMCRKQEIADVNATPIMQFIDNDQKYLQSKRYIKDRDYWVNKLTPLPHPVVEQRYLDKSQDRTLPSKVSRITLPWSNYKRVLDFTGQIKCSSPHLFIALLYIYFTKIEPNRDFLIGIPLLNRSAASFRRTMGMFVSVSPFIFKADEKSSVVDLISSIGRELQADYRHQRFPLSHVTKEIGLFRQRRAGLFNLLFSYERQDYEVTFDKTDCQAVQMFNDFTRSPLAFTLCEFHDGRDVELIFEYNRTAFNDQDFDRFKTRFNRLLNIMLDNPQMSVSEIDFIPEDERQWLLTQANLPLQPVIATPLETMFSKQVCTNPDDIALISSEKILSYGDLDRESNRLANYLKNHAVTTNSVVIIYLERSFEAIVSILAVLKAGAAFLPLDTNTPQKRLDFILEEIQPKMIISQRHLSEMLSSVAYNILMVEMFDQTISGYSDDPVDIKTEEHHLAYMIYTSGSTGIPKAVMVERKALNSRLNWLIDEFSMSKSDTMIQLFQLCFDPSIYEILLPLVTGSKLFIPPPGLQQPDLLFNIMKRHDVTIGTFVPALLQRFLEVNRSDNLPSLRLITSGGEALTQDLRDKCLRRFPAVRLLNLYGPTEATIMATSWECSTNDGKVTPVGYPIAGTTIYVLDKNQHLLPAGVVGEICIGGEALARGYYNRDDLNSKYFPTDPFNTEGARIFRTGDLGRVLSNGSLECLGRIDRQVKFRGYRIELGDIEATLSGYQTILEAAVCKINEKKSDGVIVAHIVTRDKYVINDNEIRRYLRRRLPEYMIPGHFVMHDQLPLTVNGKMDYERLSNISTTYNKNITREILLPRNELEQALVSIWESTLNTSNIGINEDFFSLGGDSLQALLVLSEMEAVLNQKISLSLFMENTTIAELGGLISDADDFCSGALMIPLSETDEDTPFYCMASGEGDIVRFSRLALELTGDCSFFMLQPPLLEKEYLNIPALAEHYSDLILTDLEEKKIVDCHLGGFSIGGLLALETAKCLVTKGVNVNTPILIDTVYPLVPKLAARFVHMFSSIVKLPFIKDINVNGRHLSLLLSDKGLTGQVNALITYQPNIYPGDIILIRSQSMTYFNMLFFRPWHKLADGDIQYHNTTGFHGGIFREGANLTELTSILRTLIT